MLVCFLKAGFPYVALAVLDSIIGKCNYIYILENVSNKNENNINNIKHSTEKQKMCFR